jgi:chlorobactene glucosyltransferase
MVYQAAVSALLVLLLLNTLLNLRSLRRARCDTGLPDPAPLVSILVPARNEEANIGACLDSLRRQDYPNYEILVLDDSSSDRTPEIVARAAAEDSRVRLLQGKPLPDGWAGKPFACHQLAQQARGPWLLFTDADTVHAPTVLRDILCTAIASQAALISGFPHQRVTSIWQKMALPIMCYYMLLCWVPLWWMQRSARPLPSVAIGQFMFFSAREYRSVGGHEAVKDRIIEDVWVAREITRRRYRQLTLDLSDLVSCQMYRGFGSMWEGMSRWLYTVASLSAVGLAITMVVVTLLFLAPFVWLAHALLVSKPALGWELLVGVQVGLLLLGRFLVGRRFSQPNLSVVLHPIGMGLVLLLSMYASYQAITGAGVRWKGRVYGA